MTVSPVALPSIPVVVSALAPGTVSEEGRDGRALVRALIGWLFLAAASYYVFRVLSGAVVTALPGEPGGGLP